MERSQFSFLSFCCAPGSIAEKLLEEGFAADVHVVPGSLEVAGVPGVRDVSVDAGVFEQERDLVLVVLPDDAVAPAAIHGVHEDDIVVVLVLFAGHLMGVVPFAGDAVFIQHALCRRIDRVADLLCGHRRRGDFKPVRDAFAPHHVFHDELRHRASADVAVADKKNLGHTFLVLLYAKICAVLRLSMGFSHLLYE